MTTRSEREKAEKLNEQHQAILSKMLREEDNKYCADCEAKGPRWASWNLGVFICIRCAGLHRKLGVHISRVKSVNLDQWTSDQIQRIQDIGNTKARQLYEANLPKNFRRPQTDQAVDLFIRDKYEKKKYYSNNVTNGGSPKDCTKKEKETERGSKVSSYTKKNDESRPVPKISPVKSSEPAVNLLGLDAPAAAPSNNGITSTSQNNNDLDIFGPMVSNPLPSSTSTAQFPQVSSSSVAGTPTQPPAAVVGGAGSGQGNLDLFNDSSSTTKTEDNAKKPLSKDSILSLYGTNMSPQAPAGEPSDVRVASERCSQTHGLHSASNCYWWLGRTRIRSNYEHTTLEVSFSVRRTDRGRVVVAESAKALLCVSAPHYEPTSVFTLDQPSRTWMLYLDLPPLLLSLSLSLSIV
ncbi:stromal membrane-associated protein 1 isoform X3 [Phyllopteryx taeniolatus]|uniref:stromal membrane-associated protein 1 isoform X3 n=1 Tax=Phyllopteryx taeniolatus TaxID=161469 RepID=UPI002AD2F8CD|nr:stromal membrane-associated protein 1 isoform X3 [Phyllopteryx taeniolatus]